MTPPPPSNRAETILVAALDHAPEDREVFLFTACGEDTALLTEVRALLAAREVMPFRLLAEPAMQDFAGGDLEKTIPHTPGPRPYRSGGRPALVDDRLSAEMKTLATPRGFRAWVLDPIQAIRGVNETTPSTLIGRDGVEYVSRILSSPSGLQACPTLARPFHRQGARTDSLGVSFHACVLHSWQVW